MGFWSSLIGSKASIAVTDPDNFSYQYRGYWIKLRPVSLEHKHTLGTHAADICLSHNERMNKPYGYDVSAYGNDIAKVCERAERAFDRLVAYWEENELHKQNGNKKIREFMATDKRFAED